MADHPLFSVTPEKLPVGCQRRPIASGFGAGHDQRNPGMAGLEVPACHDRHDELAPRSMLYSERSAGVSGHLLFSAVLEKLMGGCQRYPTASAFGIGHGQRSPGTVVAGVPTCPEAHGELTPRSV